MKNTGRDTMTDKELKSLVADLAKFQQETARSQRETDRQLKELGKQIGGLGQKFGGFTEGMAFPSMSKILTEKFGMDVVATRVKSRKAALPLELDVLAYSNSGQNQAYVVEVKSHLRPEGLEQIKKTLQQFPESFPEHKDKALYGILAVVDAPEDLRQQALNEGIYMAGIHDEQFVMETPVSFTAKNWQ
jgi:hypothetical protein